MNLETLNGMLLEMLAKAIQAVEQGASFLAGEVP